MLWLSYIVKKIFQSYNSTLKNAEKIIKIKIRF